MRTVEGAAGTKRWPFEGEVAYLALDHAGVLPGPARREACGGGSWRSSVAPPCTRHSRLNKRAEEAIPHFKHARELRLENLNYKRQAWNLGDAQRDYGTTMQAERDRGIPMHRPLHLPDLPG